MDINELRILITVLSFIVFISIVYWAYSGRQRQRFAEAANLPFLDEDLPGQTARRADEHGKGVRS